MKVERSVGAIVFRREDGQIKYLLLHRSFDPKTGFKEFWGFPRGLIEEGEDEIETVKREIKEETGLMDLTFVPGFRESIQFFFRFQGELVKKTAHYYLAEAKEGKVVLSEEHDSYAWLTFEKALDRLTHKDSKDLLKKAHEHLAKRW